MKRIVLLFVVLLNTSAFTQVTSVEAPDYKKIKKEIQQTKSDYYYPKLMERFNQADSTMTLEERRHLYYRFIYQPDYSPYGRSNYTDSLKVVLKKEQLIEEDWQDVIRFSDSILQKNPFDMRVIDYKLYGYNELKNESEFNKHITKMDIVIDAIVSSGDGTTKKTAFYVTNVSHEYDLLNVLGYDFGGSQSLIDHYDYLTLAENDAQIKGLYFDISPSLNSLSDMLKE